MSQVLNVFYLSNHNLNYSHKAKTARSIVAHNFHLQLHSSDENRISIKKGTAHKEEIPCHMCWTILLQI